MNLHIGLRATLGKRLMTVLFLTVLVAGCDDGEQAGAERQKIERVDVPTVAADSVEWSAIDATQVDEILNIAQGFGSARRDVDNVGDPMIAGRMGGQEYSVLFFDCENNANCRTIQFWSWVPGAGVTLDRVHEWNRTKRFAKAYFDADGDVVMEWDVNLWGGVSKTNLDDTFDWWRVVMPEFIEFMEE